ncbi:transcriptional regulator, LacI family [Actinopolyspora alba]|uniref:Transcriptional regulator, LacI family n=1 Tax=Actinopolyspora alba TaxID=673379 RepID=A0A1I1WY85_9ACTN|nr:LacI family DNA-binding transcriptional regulator [Actinopolyspora alba]SFE00022.1 transcriptional regulator, LacI family [Actinopolyspora alba]
MTAEIPPRQGRTTLQDVARLAGVSAKTAARAINGESNVRSDTRERVFTAAATLKFRPNRLARELRQSARTGAVGLVIGNLDNPFYSQLAAGVDHALREHDLELIIASTDDEPEREKVVVQAMLERRVTALMLVPSATDHSYLEGERQLGLPIIFLDRPPVTVVADSVLWDNHTDVRKAVHELATRGHRRISALADSPELFTATERLTAFREALTEAGIAPDETLILTSIHDATSAASATADLLARDDPPTAIIALNNRISIGAVSTLLRDDPTCAFVGFDDFDLGETLGISVVTNDPREMGNYAGQIALRRIREGTGTPERISLPTRLVQRGSGERPASSPHPSTRGSRPAPGLSGSD